MMKQHFPYYLKLLPLIICMSRIGRSKLSAEQQHCLGKITSIQNYYKLADHRTLIRIILDEKESEKLFNEEKSMTSFETENVESSEMEKIKIFA